jgi:molecular chaperone GrpE (heat shock protein)
MPLGLWKSKWEIHREDMARYHEETECRREEAERRREREERHRQESERHREKMDQHREKMEQRWEKEELQWAEYRKERARVDAEFRDLRKRSDELRDECRRDIKAAMEVVGDQLLAMRKELHENTEAVKAQTEAILKLVDRVEILEGRLFPED